MSDLRPMILIVLSILAGACSGELRETTTARTAEEMLLVTASSERAIAQIDVRPLKDKTVFVDTAALVAVDQKYIVSAFRQLCSVGGAKVVDSKDAADIVVEVRSAGVGTYDWHVTVGIPFILADGIEVPESTDTSDIPTLAEIGYILHQGWARIQCFAYERETGAYVFGWRGGNKDFGRSNNGFTNDIYPSVALEDALQKSAE